MKKKVLIIAYDGMGKSGVPRVIFEIISGLYDKFDFTLAVFKDIKMDYYYKKLNELSVDIISVPEQKPCSKFVRAYREYIGYHRYLYRFFNKCFKSQKYDIIHSFKEGDSSGIFKAAEKNKIKKRIFHTTVLHNEKSGLWGMIKKHKLELTNRYATHFVGGSKLSCKLAFSKRNYHVVPNCYDSNVFKYIEAGPFSNLEMVQVGYFSNNKNQLFSLKLCKELIKTYPVLLLHLFGYPNEKEYYDLILKYLKNNNLSNNVIIHGFNEDQIETIRNCSFSLTPSLREGFSLTLIEAQACGVRCIASNGVPNDANAGGVQYLELDIEKWVTYIKTEFAKNGGRHTQFNMDKFSRDNFIKNIGELYK